MKCRNSIQNWDTTSVYLINFRLEFKCFLFFSNFPFQDRTSLRDVGHETGPFLEIHSCQRVATIPDWNPDLSTARGVLPELPPRTFSPISLCHKNARSARSTCMMRSFTAYARCPFANCLIWRIRTSESSAQTERHPGMISGVIRHASGYPDLNASEIDSIKMRKRHLVSTDLRPSRALPRCEDIHVWDSSVDLRSSEIRSDSPASPNHSITIGA